MKALANTTTNVHYYIAPSGTEDLYSPALYDEETLVYTDPVTGTEYLTNGWTYDYTTRCYTLDMADDTFTIDGTVIDTIKLTYGDELLTVDHYASGSLIQSDEYNYMVAAESECTLFGHTYNTEITTPTSCLGPGERTYTCSVCGDQYVEEIAQLDHSYTYETLKESTCTSLGERKYTCSACGHQYVEDVPMSPHSYSYSVLKQPTCVDPGINIYTCATCGNQVTEESAALGHDWQETSSTSTAYALPAGTSCPDCAGADFAAELDEQAGTYSCTCNGCGTVWTVSAIITQGTTTYTCSRCGTTKTESDDAESGLFHSIGNLIADGITWATDKMKELVENLSGINDIFNDYADSVRENTGQFPTFLGALIALMPEDFMTVIWFGVVALIVLAVWKKWFS